MEELLAQLDNNCFGLDLFPTSFFPEHSLLVLSRTKNFPTQKNPPQVQVVVSDKIAPVFWVITQQMEGLYMSIHFTAHMPMGGKFYMFDHEEENSPGKRFSAT